MKVQGASQPEVGADLRLLDILPGSGPTVFVRARLHFRPMILSQDVGLIYECDEMLQRDVAKYSEMVAHWSGEAPSQLRHVEKTRIPQKKIRGSGCKPKNGWVSRSFSLFKQQAFGESKKWSFDVCLSCFSRKRVAFSTCAKGSGCSLGVFVSSVLWTLIHFFGK